ADRRRALDAVEGVAGPEEELGEAAQSMLRQLRAALGFDTARKPLVFEAAAVPHTVY
ncbi:MAG: hypothetical protein IRY87_31245, partial [Acetobacteraceae bacterium]|nr:hypothetical protein [Acetobacteraceae bacterium]